MFNICKTLEWGPDVISASVFLTKFKYILTKHNSFIFESVEKGETRGRYTIIGYNAEKIWDFKKNTLKITNKGKVKNYKVKPLKYLNNLIEEFKTVVPKGIPSMSTMLVGYFS